MDTGVFALTLFCALAPAISVPRPDRDQHVMATCKPTSASSEEIVSTMYDHPTQNSNNDEMYQGSMTQVGAQHSTAPPPPTGGSQENQWQQTTTPRATAGPSPMPGGLGGNNGLTTPRAGFSNHD